MLMMLHLLVCAYYATNASFSFFFPQLAQPFLPTILNSAQNFNIKN